MMNITTDLRKTKHDDYFELSINGVKLGTWEQSQVRQLIEDLDNLIHH